MAFTYFFRDIQTLRLIGKDVLPAIRGYKYIRIWDAGCADGPEPYSIAITLRENMSHFLFRNVRICATDSDTSRDLAKIISEGTYPPSEVKRIPADIRQRYFVKDESRGHYKIADEIKARVTFKQHDLRSLDPVRSGFAMVVCKNVLLHLTPRERVGVIRMFHSALTDGGFLVMEQTQEIPWQVRNLFERATVKGQVFRKLKKPISVGVEKLGSSGGHTAAVGV